MVSLLPTCWGSTQPASDPTAKVSVPPAFGAPEPPASEPPPEPHAADVPMAATSTAADAHVVPRTEELLLLSGSPGAALVMGSIPRPAAGTSGPGRCGHG